MFESNTVADRLLALELWKQRSASRIESGVVDVAYR
jgi:hypothetical protein